MTHEITNNSIVAHREDLNDELFIIRVETNTKHKFIPGQYVELAVPDKQNKNTKIIKRAYSIASSPLENYLEFYIVKVENGALSPFLHKLKVGDQLWVGEKIKGKFTLEPFLESTNKDHDLFLIATGTGIAPYISMIDYYTKQPSLPWKNLVIIHGARFEKDLGYKNKLIGLSNERSDFFYIPSITRETPSSEYILKGRINELINSKQIENRIGNIQLEPETSQVYLCGNPEMIEQTKQLLELRSFSLHKKSSPGNIHFERYW